jgi:hypothetical protein
MSWLSTTFDVLTGKNASDASKKNTKAQLASSEKMTTLQTLFAAGQQQTTTLVELLNAKKANRPVYTVPQVQPRTWLEELNWKIHAVLHGGA